MDQPDDFVPAFADSVEWALSTTRSVRRRLDWERPVERSLIEACINVAVQAPTGANLEAWRFLVLDEPEPKAALAALYRRAMDTYAALRPGASGPKPRARELADRLETTPALILVCAEGAPPMETNAMRVAFYGSVLPAAWSLMVALRARGVGSTWTTLHLVHEAEAAQALGIPEGVTQTVLLPIGHMANAHLRPAKRRPATEVTYWNRWGRENKSH
ncbi:MAG: nitroreductase family protein [Deltaproteobacteria bacterium]|nr:nitroreductase family protein [Deltaproteobacteria bacterium]MBW2393776.1 nitroreductase family protein [Deltaproteobacteria bacterium]